MDVSQILLTVVAVIGIVVICVMAIVPTAMNFPRPVQFGAERRKRVAPQS